MSLKKLGRQPLVTTAVLYVVVVTAATASGRCMDVDLKLAPCLPYLENGGEPSFYCCIGVSALTDAAADSTSERRNICKCLKKLHKAIPKIEANNIEDLPKRCHLPVPNPITLKTDCGKIK